MDVGSMVMSYEEGDELIACDDPSQENILSIFVRIISESFFSHLCHQNEEICGFLNIRESRPAFLMMKFVSLPRLS